ncbi:hypothetical protein JTB14_033875 [Gonioctena quinquepunctata]|nr:hypothetical protein JTB14_033875 [Gonioctena quinquepunctata]
MLCMWVSVTLSDGKKLNICCVYIPPHAILNNFILFFQKLEEILSNHESSNFMIVGDFNHSNLMWEFDYKLASYRPRYVTDILSQYFINMCLLNSKQYFNILNVNQKVLDSNNVAVKRCTTPFVKKDVLHPALEIVKNIPISRSLPPNSYTKLRFELKNN